MAIGAGTTAADLNARLCALTQVREVQAVLTVAFAAYVDGLGAGGLELAGMDSGDAAAFQSAADDLKTDALIFQGQATQGSTFNYGNALAAFIGPTPQQTTL
ncbi:MAG TPA: hypothetical protein VIZ43_08595 [Trebonia sp.]